MKSRFMYCVILVFTISISGLAQTKWEWANPLPQGNTLNSVIYGNNQFVAVGGGKVLTSSDGATWTAGSSVNPSLIFVTFL